MKCALLLIFLAVPAFAQGSGDEEVPHTKWKIELTTEDAVPADGHHIGLSWQRDYNPLGTVVIFRREVPKGTTGEGKPILVVDQKAQIVPAFMYPDTFKTKYYPAIDTSQQPIPKGTKLGVWTVADSVDGDRELWIDEVPDPDALYEYAFVPAHRAGAPDTYDSMMGSSVITPPLAPKQATTLLRRRWFQIAVLGAFGALVAGTFALRRRRAGAKPPGEAS
jgi:hypothetical protein